MGKLIIDGDSVFEIDEECMKRRKVSSKCDVDKYFSEDTIRDRKHKGQQEPFLPINQRKKTVD